MLLIALTALAEHIEKQNAALEGIEAVGPGLACEVERPQRRCQLEFGLFRQRVHGLLLELIRDTARSAIRPASRTLCRLDRAQMRCRSLKERHAKSPRLVIQFVHAHLSVMPMSPGIPPGQSTT